MQNKKKRSPLAYLISFLFCLGVLMITGFSANKESSRIINSHNALNVATSITVPIQSHANNVSSEVTDASPTPIYNSPLYLHFVALCTILSLCGVFVLAIFIHRD